MSDSPAGTQPERERSQFAQVAPSRDLNDRLVLDLIDAVKGVLRKETSDRLRDVYLIGDIEKDIARNVIERLRELANDNTRPITLYMNTAGGNVTDGLAIHDSIRQIVHRGIEVTIVVQGMAYSMGSVVLQAVLQDAATQPEAFTPAILTTPPAETAKEVMPVEPPKVEPPGPVTTIIAERSGRELTMCSEG